MKRKDKALIFYLIGIIVLVVAIIGVTFAFFAVAIEQSGSDIVGSTLALKLEMSITPKSAGFDKPLIPQETASIANAVLGVGNGSCVDSSGNTVCQVYEIMIENAAVDPVTINGTFTLTANTMADLKWGLGTSATAGFAANKTYAKSETDLIGPGVSGVQSITLKANDGVDNSGADTALFYVVTYIEETEQEQSSTNRGSFAGTVTFSAVGGENGITATFAS